MIRATWHLLGAFAKGSAFLCVLVLPVVLFISVGMPDDTKLAPQPAAAVSFDAAFSTSVPAYRDAVPVVAYGEISHRPGAVSPKRFAAHMRALAEARFRTVTIAEVSAFLLSGKPLPPRAIAITFERSLGNLWLHADPVMKRSGFRATAFVAPSLIDRHLPYNLSRAQLEKLRVSGRWDFEAMLAPGERATSARLDQILRKFKAHRLPAPVALLYPRGGSAEPPVAKLFPLSFLVSGELRFLARSHGQQQLPVKPVDAQISPARLLGQLLQAVPLAPRVTDALHSAEKWQFEGGASKAMINRGWFRPTAVPRRWLAAYYAPLQTRDWRRYQVRVTVAQLGSATSGANATLLVGRNPQAAITLSAHRLRIEPRDGKSLPLVLAIPEGSEHELQVTVSGDGFEVRVDGNLLAKRAGALRGGIGLGVWLEKETSPNPTFTRLAISPL